MSITLIVGSNTWISLEDAQTYFESRLNADAWETTKDNQQKALVTAFKQLNSGVFTDLPGTASQAMKDAQCEQALFLLQQAGAQDARGGLQAQGVVSAGIVKEQYDLEAAKRLPLAPVARQLLSAYYNPEGSTLLGVDVERDEEEDV